MSNKNPKKGMKVMNDFRKFATQKLGMNGLVLDEVVKAQQQYMNPYILEERQLNVTQMDVYSRLMMDRIIFLGSEIDDYVANTLQAQLLYMEIITVLIPRGIWRIIVNAVHLCDVIIGIPIQIPA